MNYQQVLALIQQFIVANGNNEITANVLRPILEAILAQPNELIGDLGDLQTIDQTNIVAAINEALGAISPIIGSDNTKIHYLSLDGIDPNLPELSKIAEAVRLQGPFTCNASEQMVFKTITTIGSGSIATRYYRLIKNVVSIGGQSGPVAAIPPFLFMPDGEGMYQNPEDEGIIAELGNIGTDNVWDAFNLGNAGEAWDMELYRFVRATQNGEIKIWAFTGLERFYGGPDMIIEPDIYEAFENDFFDITDQPADGGGTGIYQGASPTTRTVGGLNSGTNISGKTYDELFESMLAEYVAPSISSFSMAGQNSPIEVGTAISGNKNFSFGFSQSGNVANNTVKIIDVTNSNTVLASGLSKSSPQSVDVGSVAKTTATDNVWRIEAESTKSATIARNMSIEWQYRYFFGGSATDVDTSAKVRALAMSGLDSGGTNNVNVVAGTSNTDFYFFVHNSRKINTVLDTSALNADITSAYVLIGTMTVKDAGGNDQTYKKYKLTLAAAYGSNHTHRITLTND